MPQGDSNEYILFFKSLELLLGISANVLQYLVAICTHEKIEKIKEKKKQKNQENQENPKFSDIFNVKKLKKDGVINKDEVEILKSKSSTEGMDITILSKMFLKLIDIPKNLDSEKMKNYEIIKDNILKLLECRNEISHTPKFNELVKTFGKDEKLQKIKEYCSGIVSNIPLVYECQNLGVEEFITKFNRDINDLMIKQIKIKDNDNRLFQLFQERFRIFYKQWYDSSSSFSSTQNLFRFSTLKEFYVELKMMNSNNSVQSQNILALFNQSPADSPFILVKGPAGAGKSTLIQRIIYDWVNKENNFSEISQYDFLFYVECRDRQIKSFDELIESSMKDGYSKDSSNSKKIDIENIFEDRKVLVLIDGLDEINEESTSLINNLISKFPTQHFLMTTRQECEQNLVTFRPQNKNVEYLELNGINVGQRTDFIKKHLDALSKNIKILNKSAEDLENLIMNSQPHIGDMVILPLNLALITYYYATESEFNLECETDLVQKIISSSEEKQIERIKKSQSLDEDLLKQKVEALRIEIEKIAHISLFKNEMILSQETVDHLIDYCSKENLRMDEALAPYLSFKNSFITRSIRPTYIFHHKTIQEYMSAKHILSELKKDSEYVKYLKRLRNTTRRQIINGTFFNVLRILMKLMAKEPDAKELLDKFFMPLYNIEYGTQKKITLDKAREFMLKAAPTPMLIEEMSKYVSVKEWTLGPLYFKFASLLLKYITPAVMVVKFTPYFEKPFDSFIHLLQCATEYESIKISIYDSVSPEKHDEEAMRAFSEVIQNMRCQLEIFEGYLPVSLHKVAIEKFKESVEITITTQEEFESFSNIIQRINSQEAEEPTEHELDDRDSTEQATTNTQKNNNQKICLKLRIDSKIPDGVLIQIRDMLKYVTLISNDHTEEEEEEEEEEEDFDEYFRVLECLFSPCSNKNKDVRVWIQSNNMDDAVALDLLNKLKNSYRMFKYVSLSFDCDYIAESNIMEVHEDHRQICQNCTDMNYDFTYFNFP